MTINLVDLLLPLSLFVHSTSLQCSSSISLASVDAKFLHISLTIENASSSSIIFHNPRSFGHGPRETASVPLQKQEHRPG